MDRLLDGIMINLQDGGANVAFTPEIKSKLSSAKQSTHQQQLRFDSRISSIFSKKRSINKPYVLDK